MLYTDDAMLHAGHVDAKTSCNYSHLLFSMSYFTHHYKPMVDLSMAYVHLIVHTGGRNCDIKQEACET